MLTLGFVMHALGAYQPTGQEPVVSSVVVDSRQAQPGSLFVAFSGERVDGHEFVADAFARGAIGALVERAVAGWPVVQAAEMPASLPPTPFCILVPNTLSALQTVAGKWRAQFAVKTIGITGSIGKTTTKELAAAVLSQRYRTLKTEGNLNNEIGVPLTLLQLTAAHEYAVLEMGTYAKGEIALLCRLAQPEIGVVTIIGPVHLERLGSIEAIVEAKRELIEALPPHGRAILNHDEPLVMSMADHSPAPILTYGLSPEADLWASDVESMGLEGIRFWLHHGDDHMHVRLPLLGRHSVHTALRAAAVGLVAGLTWDEIVRGLSGDFAQLRLVAVEGPRDSVVIDDTYNASPESTIAALNLLADLDGRRVAVLGDMLELGAATEPAHRLVGRRALEVVDVLLAVGKLGRLIGQEALAAGMPASSVHLLDTPDEATTLLEQIIQSGDIILVKGSRGARLDTIVAALSRPA